MRTRAVSASVAEDILDAGMHDVEAELMVLLTRVRRTSSQLARQIHPELQAAGYAVLLRLAKTESTRAADLVVALDLDKGFVSRQVAQLERLGLVERSADESDGRAQRISLTVPGRHAVDQIYQGARADFRQRLSTWSAEDVAKFATVLRRYNATFQS
jgi:DNA-binding MarR family transcriptional regulator